MTHSLRPITILLIFIFFTGLTVQAQAPVTQLVIRHIEATTESGPARVSAFVAAINQDGQPVTGLTANNFTVTENNVPISPDSFTVAPAVNPISVTLLIDTSSLMTQSGSDGIRMIDAARDAAIKFIESLKPGDEAAIYEYNTQLQSIQDSTIDHNMVINQSYNLEAREVKNACLPVALSEMINRLPASLASQHLVLAITGSPDGPAEECGGKTIDDALATLTASGARIPVFSVGLGNKVNQENLTRLARLTGGQSFSAADAPAAVAAIMKIVDQLQRQYEISYSTQTVGLVKVIITETGSGQSDSRQVLVPEAVPPTSTPLPPFSIDMEIRLDKDKLKIEITAPAEVSLAKTELWIDGDLKHRNDTPPFEQFELDLAQLGSGKHTIRVEAAAENGMTARAEREMNLEVPPTPLPSPTPIPQLTPTPAASGLFSTDGFLLPLLLIGAGVLLLILVIGLVAYLILTGKRTPASAVSRPLAPPPPMITTDYGDGLDAGKTHDPYEGGGVSAVKARLVVVTGNQAVSQTSFDLCKAETTLGRNTQRDSNDIAIQDAEVSRSHAKIIYREQQFFIQDIGSSTGTRITRINENKKITPFQDVLLQNNDEITIGPKIKFKLELSDSDDGDTKLPPDSPGDEVTKEEDPDQTIHRFRPEER